MDPTKKRDLLDRSASASIMIIPGLPDDVAVRVLVRVPRALHATFRLVCRAWRDALQPSAVSSLRNTLHISDVWILFRFGESIALYDPLLQCLSSPTPYFCTTDRFTRVLGAIGSQVLVLEDPDDLDDEAHIHCFDAASMQWQSDYFVLWNNAAIYDPAAAVVDGHLILAGGAVESGMKRLKNVARLDVKSRTWEMMPKMHERRIRAAAVVFQGRLLVIGGTSIDEYDDEEAQSGEIWDPQSGKWVLEPGLWPTEFAPMRLHRQVAVVMNILYALNDIQYKNDLELLRYESSSKVWISLGHPPAQEYACSCSKQKVGFAQLVEAGKELWVVLNCIKRQGRCTASIISCVPTTEPSPLLWSNVPITYSAKFPTGHLSVDGIVHV